MKAKSVIESLNEAYAEKDIKRIEDIFKKGKGNDEKVLQLTRTMAKLIKDPTKALARAEAAEQILGSDHNQIADIFYEREAELRGDSPAEPRAPKSASASKANVSVPSQNPEVKSDEFDKPETNRGFYRRAMPNVGVIFLPTTSAIALWNWELTGQFSDGAWENSKPDEHWVYWSNLETRLGQPQVQSTGHPLKTGYNLAGLIQYVGDRMVATGRFGKAVGTDILNMGSGVRGRVENFPKDGPFDLETRKEEMINKYGKNDYYWKGLEQKHVDAYYATKYDMKDMRKDLSIIKTAMKNIKRII